MVGQRPMHGWPIEETAMRGVSIRPWLGRFDIPQRFDDPAIPHSHQIDPAHRAFPARSPVVAPKDDSALAKDAQILGLEERSRRRCDGRPESDAGLAPDMARSIGRRLRILDDTVLS